MRVLRALLLLLLPVAAVAHPGGGLIALDANTVIFGDSMYNAIWRLEQGKKQQALISKFHAHWTTRGLDGQIYSESFQEMGGAAFRIDLAGSKHVKVAEESHINTLVFAVGKRGEFIFQKGTQLVERTAAGTVKPFRGSGEVAPGEPPLQQVIAYVWTADETLYLSDGGHIRRVGSDGVVRLVARIDGKLIEPKIWNSIGAPRIWSIAIDDRKRIYAALPDIGQVVRIDADGSQHVVDRSVGGWRVTAVATFNDSVFMLESSDSTNDGQRVRVIRGSGKVELLGQIEPPKVAAQDKVNDNDSFDSFSIPTIPEVRISSGLVATFKNGDFVHPTFSPDGRRLAYANVLVKGDVESTEVLLSDLRTRRQSVLLTSRRAKQYSTYKVFVSEMQWKTANRVEVWLGDGDVGSTQLSLNPFSRKLLQERFEDFDDVEALQLTPDNQKAYLQAREIFPSLHEGVLQNELLDPAAVVIPDQGVVLQTNYTGEDNNVWFLDFKNKSAKSLINLTAGSRSRFEGGVRFNSSLIMVVSRNQKTRLFLYQEGKIRGLGEFDSPNFNQIEVKYLSSSKVIFLVRTHPPSEPGDNPLFIFDGSQLQRITDYPQLHDAAVAPSGKRIAYCYWVGDKRHIVVKDLN